jgi:hypothetical protein
MPGMRGIALLFLILAHVVGCAGLPRSPADLRVGAVQLVKGGGGREVDRLLEGLYDRDLAFSELRALAQTALAKSPQSGPAHEAAAYLGDLADDPHEAWFHFWKAAQDLDDPFTALYLWEMNIDPTRAEMEATLELCDAIRKQHPRPAVRAVATIWQMTLLRRLGKTSAAEKLLPSNSSITPSSTCQRRRVSPRRSFSTQPRMASTWATSNLWIRAR